MSGAPASLENRQLKPRNTPHTRKILSKLRRGTKGSVEQGRRDGANWLMADGAGVDGESDEARMLP